MDIRNLGVIGDRRTAALLSVDGTVVWYCPGRFDRPSLFASLLDEDHGGAWSVELPGAIGGGRRYLEDSGVLETCLRCDADKFIITDWMPMGEALPTGICRQFSAAPKRLVVRLSPAPNYGRASLVIERISGIGNERSVCIADQYWLYASHPLQVTASGVYFELPAGAEGWAVLSDVPLPAPSRDDLNLWLRLTLAAWREIAGRATYRGPFEHYIAQSLRALRLLTHDASGGVIAAATTSLPEVPGGTRNYDYRYVWLRDASMIVSALVRVGSRGPDEQRFLDFICRSARDDPQQPPLPPLMSLDGQSAADEIELDLEGYQSSRPVRIGNAAHRQMQLDGYANVLLAAKLVYSHTHTRSHWPVIERVADYLCAHWREPDYGIWEERTPAQYTVGKVITACGLHYLTDYSQDPGQIDRWRNTVAEIRRYVARHCLTAEGAYADVAGSQDVDVTAALYPVWGYIAPDAPEMRATLHALERNHSDGRLFWRHLREPDAGREGAFLAGTLWVAQYRVMCGELGRARTILEAVLEYANDLGLFAEEAGSSAGEMLGNFPQAFVHAAFIGAVVDYRDALEKRCGKQETPLRAGIDSRSGATGFHDERDYRNRLCYTYPLRCTLAVGYFLEPN